MTAVEWSEVVRNWAIVVGGAIGFGIAIWRAWVADRAAKTQAQQATLARQEHVVAMFDKAVDRLSSERLRDRIAAIILIDDLTKRYPDLAGPAVDLLDAFLQDVLDGNAGDPIGGDYKKALDVMMRETLRGRGGKK